MLDHRNPSKIDRELVFIEDIFEAMDEGDISSDSEISPYVHTPKQICQKKLDKLVESRGNLNGNILVLNPEYISLLISDRYDTSQSTIHFYTDDIYMKRIVDGIVFEHSNIENVEITVDDTPVDDILGCYFEDNSQKNITNRDVKMQFDVVVGNPPYQKPGDESSNKLWKRFVKKSFNLLVDGGYLSLIHPGSWKRYATPNYSSILRDYFQKYTFHHLQINTAKEYFDVNSSFDWYVIEKTESQNNTFSIKTDRKEESFKQSIDDLPCVPQNLTNTSLNVTRKFINYKPKLDVKMSRELDTYSTDYISKERKDDFKYPVKHTSGKIRWSSKKHSDQNEKKILMSLSGYLSPEYDEEGKFGVTQHCLYILVDGENEANYILNLLNSKLYTYFRRVNKWSGFHHQNLLKQMPYVKGLDLERIDQELCEYFDLSKDEIKDIENYIS